MKPSYRFINSVSAFIIWLLTISAISGICLGELDWFMRKTPLNLLMILVLLIWAFPLQQTKPVLLFIFIALSSIFAEWLGVNYGLIFGEYEYGNNFGPKIGRVPYMIGVNWAFLSFVTGAIAQNLISGLWQKALIGAGLMLILDFFLEFSAPIFDFWYWDAGDPPLQNFIGWYSLSLIYQLLYHKLNIQGNVFFSYQVYGSQLLFFVFFYFFFNGLG